MKTTHDMSALSWKLAGFTPHFWMAVIGEEWLTSSTIAEVAAIPARVPGSVQQALHEAGLIPDWNRGMDALACEWVEHRHWVYEAALPDEWFAHGDAVLLRAIGLDYAGWVYVNDALVCEFRGGHAPLAFDLAPHLRASGNKLRIIFGLPPRWLGYTGFTSKFTEWKARFSYSWDWMVRFVTAGVWDDLTIDVADGPRISTFDCLASLDGTGTLMVSGTAADCAGCTVSVTLSGEAGVLRTGSLAADEFAGSGMAWSDLAVEPWWPNGHGDQTLYTVECILRDSGGVEHDHRACRVGFRSVRWEPCEGAPPSATPWLCVVNDRPIFLQGINWTPIRPNFHDLTYEDYRRLLVLYRDTGVNCLRVWGGGILEKGWFYDLCDEMGLLVWQEFPLSSSTFDNWPPEDPSAVAELTDIASVWVDRLRRHPSLLMWCGGNELSRPEGAPLVSRRIPVDFDHPLIAALASVVERLDPGRRFVATSPYGPEFFGDAADYGKGVHWDVHGPWRPDGSLDAWREYWSADDSLIRSEVGCPGASPTDIIEQYCASEAFVRPTPEGPRFRRQFDSWWWLEWAAFEAETGREPADVGEFVAWSQARQAEALAVAARACKDRFPRCGGIVLWMGHDSFPCSSNTSIVDFLGRPKPAVTGLREVFAI